ncbi:hypothetical protein MAR_022096 [Mya arenaria]|uniref:Uncharacterized protein n=1 Tax=Mya arenaria TaxID=6604 RepID=A0ABY7DNS6_MYAAR|nr:hypothetical protein MAR_022096 [Mya arenaria]
MSTITNESNIETLKQDVASLESSNKTLSKANASLTDAVIDHKCRSMRDNMLLFGIPEGRSWELGTPSYQAVSNTEHLNDTTDPASNSTAIPNNQPPTFRDSLSVSENCEAKVFYFLVNTCLTCRIRNQQYRLIAPTEKEPYPTEVKEHRKELIPAMFKARSESKRAVLVRDKLFIGNRLYTPGSSAIHTD